MSSHISQLEIFSLLTPFFTVVVIFFKMLKTFILIQGKLRLRSLIVSAKREKKQSLETSCHPVFFCLIFFLKFYFNFKLLPLAFLSLQKFSNASNYVSNHAFVRLSSRFFIQFVDAKLSQTFTDHEVGLVVDARNERKIIVIQNQLFF